MQAVVVVAAAVIMVRSPRGRTRIRTQAIRRRAAAEAISFPQESMFLQARARAPGTAVPTGDRAIRANDHGSSIAPSRLRFALLLRIFVQQHSIQVKRGDRPRTTNDQAPMSLLSRLSYRL
jgi:hypothetical protein